MLKVRMLFVSGLFVVILQYLGFPTSWKNILLVLSGLFIIFLAYIFYREIKNKNGEENNFAEPFDNFLENDNFKEENKIQ
jgi:cbb3-type cytochrome oxidase subunit 3